MWPSTTLAVAADDHRDLARRGEVHAAGHRRLERRDPLARAASSASRSSSCRSFVLMSIHVPPWRERRQHTVRALDDRRHGGRRGQARDHGVRAVARRAPAKPPTSAPASTSASRPRSASRSCTDEREPGTQQARREVAAEATDADEADASPSRPARRRASDAARRRRTGWPRATSSSSSTPRPGPGRRDHVAVLPARSAAAGSRRGSRPSAGSPRGRGSSGCTPRAGCSRRRRRGRSRDAARSGRSAPRPSRRSSSPRAARRPGRGSAAGSTRRRSASTRANSYFVVSRSPVAIGIDVARATDAIASGLSGGTGSSSQSGSKRSSRRASRIAPDGVNCPCVPRSRSQRSPTASRTRPTYASGDVERLEARLPRVERRVAGRAGRTSAP